ncbi:MAG: hypoxanthine phosphoribosyltransferase [Defluviitaleaceae bacterium]|nr:hypoxanthine phosphoribosyltransferase [Defluviitaleaceae bacterium]
MKNEIVSVLYTAEQISGIVNDIAAKIENDFEGKEVVLICVLTGSIMFVSDLARAIGDKVSVRIDVISASSYGNDIKSSGNVCINLDVREDLKDKNVIIVEDIIDSGRTLDSLIRHLNLKEPRTLKICTLLNKEICRLVEHKGIVVDYVGFDIDDHFVVGYGIDYAQKYRNLPYVGVISFAD